MATKESTDDGDERTARQKMGEGIRQGVGVLSAFKDALEETIQEARDRGELSTERAKEVMKGALDRAQAAAAGARERLDFVNQIELEALEGAVEDLRDRVSALEEEVFGGPLEAPGGRSEPESQATA
jgi:polyhydroxyalkanoate synthesis regulator phasin